VAAVLRLGLTEKGVTEILAVSEHTVSLCAAAEGLRIPSDVPTEPKHPDTALVAPLSDAEVGDAGPTIAAITSWSREHLGRDRAPAFWRVLAHQPRFLQATWAKDRLVMGAGELDATAKACTALAVAMFRQSSYWTGYLAQQLRHDQGMSDAILVELTAAVMHYVSFNTVAHGMRLAAPHTDMSASEFGEGSS
jgi:hypothetical protein